MSLPSLAFTAVLAGAFALAVTPPAAHAQPRDVRGVVTDSAGRGISNAEVRILALDRLVRTDAAGAFQILGIRDRVVDLAVRRLGYQVQFVRVSLINGEGDGVRVIMYDEPIRLTAIEIEAPAPLNPMFAGFEQRRARGIGTYITADQIARLNSSYASDVFRGLAGMRVVRVSGGNGVRFTSTQGMRNARGGECQPTIWVDGQAAPGLEIDDIRSADIHGIEIYRGTATTPPQFAAAGTVQCGAIVVWTKRKERP